MNPVLVWITVGVLVLSTIFIWYITYPIVFSILNFGQTTVTNSGILPSIQAYGLQSFSVLDWLNLAWAPIFCIIYIIWGNLAMHEVDVESQYYG